MQLKRGARLGPYEILDSIGAGGMGEVYRARDPRLDRLVAIKVLPGAFAANEDRLRRFEQEARAAASIDHPNVVAVHDAGWLTPLDGADGVTPYIVTELLDGHTLGDRMRQSALPISKVVDYARQILSGLASVHARGIVHRDLKPANVFITSDERVKILDFGVAKLTEPIPEGAHSGTTVTGAGTVLGTVGYMSPEQVRGRPADQRSDLFAVGAILYEMLARTPAFRGQTDADTLAQVLNEDPPELPVVERRISPALVRIVRRCLEKTPASRFQTASDLAFALESATAVSDSALPAQVALRPLRSGWLWFAGAVVALSAFAVAGFAYLQAPAAVLAYHSTIVPPADVGGFSLAPPLALSPDGRKLVFAATDAAGDRRLWVRRLDEPTADPLAGTDGAVGPFWSPDSRHIGFFADQVLKKVDIGGGPPLVLGGPGATRSLGGTWNDDDVILYTGLRGLQRVAAGGGTAVAVTTADESVGEVHTLPFFLPDGRRFLYLAVSQGGATALYVGSLDTPERKLVIEDVVNAQYAEGMLVFLRGATLLAQPFDYGSATLTGSATPIADQIQVSTGSFSDATLRPGAFSVSESGALVYLRNAEATDTQLLWIDRSGKVVGVLGDPAAYGDVFISRDGRLATVSIDAGTGTRDLWAFDLARSGRTRLTFDPGNEYDGIWSPDGSRLVFNSSRNGVLDLYAKTAGSDALETLLEGGLSKFPQDISPDGRFLAYLSVDAAQDQDIFILPMEGTREPFPFVATHPYSEGTGVEFSPDGRWISYTSAESGRQEVYVKPFPDTGARWLVSINGGLITSWRSDGRELYYVEQVTNRLMAVSIAEGADGLRIGAPEVIAAIKPAGPRRFYDAMPDGQRFLVNSVLDEAARAPITLVVNWRSLLDPAP